MGLQEAGSREEGHRPPTSRAVELGPAGTWWNPRLRRRTSACRLEVPRLKAILCKRKLSKSWTSPPNRSLRTSSRPSEDRPHKVNKQSSLPMSVNRNSVFYNSHHDSASREPLELQPDPASLSADHPVPAGLRAFRDHERPRADRGQWDQAECDDANAEKRSEGAVSASRAGFPWAIKLHCVKTRINTNLSPGQVS